MQATSQSLARLSIAVSGVAVGARSGSTQSWADALKQLVSLAATLGQIRNKLEIESDGTVLNTELLLLPSHLVNLAFAAAPLNTNVPEDAKAQKFAVAEGGVASLVLAGTKFSYTVSGNFQVTSFTADSKGGSIAQPTGATLEFKGDKASLFLDLDQSFDKNTITLNAAGEGHFMAAFKLSSTDEVVNTYLTQWDRVWLRFPVKKVGSELKFGSDQQLHGLDIAPVKNAGTNGGAGQTSNSQLIDCAAAGALPRGADDCTVAPGGKWTPAQIDLVILPYCAARQQMACD